VKYLLENALLYMFSAPSELSAGRGESFAEKAIYRSALRHFGRLQSSKALASFNST